MSAAVAAAKPPPVAPLSTTAPIPDVSVSVFPSAIVRVEPVAGVVKATLLTVVADATPKAGVVNAGDVVIATSPDPETVYSPKTPELSYNILVFVPPEIVVVPTIIEVAPPPPVPHVIPVPET